MSSLSSSEEDEEQDYVKVELLFTKQREYMMITWCDINRCAEQLINLTQSVFVALVQKTSQFKVTSDEIANYARFVTEAIIYVPKCDR